MASQQISQSRDAIERIDLENWVRQIIEDPTLQPYFQDWLEDRGWSRDLHEKYLFYSCVPPEVFVRKRRKEDRCENWLEEEIWNKLPHREGRDLKDPILKYFNDKQDGWVELLIAVNS